MKRATSAGRWSGIFVIGAALLSAFSWAQSPTFTLHVLSETSGQTWGAADGINNAGQVVGVTSGSVCPAGCAVIWHDGTTTVLGAVEGAIGYGPLSINNAGQVAGTVEVTPNDSFQAVIWNNGLPTLLPAPGPQYTNTYASSLNDAGVVVGEAAEPSFVGQVPVQWNGLTPTVLAEATGCKFGSYASGINNSGIVVGVTYCPLTEPGAWRGTTATVLPTVTLSGGGHGGGKAVAVNDLGLVVGTANNAEGYITAAAWENGVITNLGILSDGGSNTALSVNNRGIIVGEASTEGYHVFHAALWSSVHAAPQDLNSLISTAAAAEFELIEATGINDNCSIVASGYNRETATAEAFLLTLIDASSCVNGL
jgi:probable HAF family extracellular repeat protein